MADEKRAVNRMTGAIEGLSHEFQFDRRATETVNQQNSQPAPVEKDMPIIAIEFLARSCSAFSLSVPLLGTAPLRIVANGKTIATKLAINVLWEGTSICWPRSIGACALASPITDPWASPPRKAGDHRSFGKAGGHDRLLTPRRCSSRPTMCQKKAAFKSVETLKAMRGSQ